MPPEPSPVVVVDSDFAAEIRAGVKECLDRGLTQSAKWLSELLLSIPPSKRKGSQSAHSFSMLSTSTPARSQSHESMAGFAGHSPIATQILSQPPAPTTPHLAQVHLTAEDIRAMELNMELDEQDALHAARACYEAREFVHAVRCLKDCKSSKAKFLSVYCRFIFSEKQAQRDWHKLDNHRQQPAVPINQSLGELLDNVRDSRDPWLLFLKALLLSRQTMREEAIECALLSIAGFKWNWGTWMLLASCIGDGEELSSVLQLIPLPSDHPLVHMFQIKAMNELRNPTENDLQLCERLLGPDYFPNSLWLMAMRASALFHLKRNGEAEKEFERILAIDPDRIDDIDIYSHILYLNEDHLKLSRLAHDFLALDKDRPEVCLLVGNYYSLRADHEKAVKYFRRATQLDRTYLTAWALMGHEYVEMKNAHAAIEAYRRAVDVNRKDYRAWFGLGQAYELLGMHHYSLHYFQRSTALKPYDVRLWQAQGICYEEIGRYREAIDCFKRALISAEPHEIVIKLRLAKMHRNLEEYAESVAYHRSVVEVCQAEVRPIHDYAKSILEIADYEMKLPNGNLVLARDYLELVASSHAEEVTKATEMLKDVKAKIQERAALKSQPAPEPVIGGGGS